MGEINDIMFQKRHVPTAQIEGNNQLAPESPPSADELYQVSKTYGRGSGR